MAGVTGRRASWGSVLPVNGFAAIRSVGFEPIGQVFGAAGYPLTATAAVSCPGTPTHSDVPGAPAGRIAEAIRDGYLTAIGRMTGECSDLGGHGVVGMSLTVTEIPGDSFTAPVVAFKVMGTAVRANNCLRLPRPFTTELTGSDFAKLLLSGWVPAGIALGISVAGLHDDLVTTSSGSWGTGNAEVPSYTELMAYVRQDARSRLEQQVRILGADGIVVSATAVKVRSDRCHTHPSGTDHFAEALITGSVVAQFADIRNATQASRVAVLSLGTR
jgi:uncharacterized protein YbjQ (UPF0145 family)